MESIDVFAPLASLQWVDRNTIHANDYNPNKVSEENLKLLIQSILTNGWTLPIVVRPDGTIIDGFHRWTVSGREPLLSLLGGKVPVVVVDHHGDESADVYGTITHNRARGTHLLEPMKAIVKKLIDEGKTVEEIGKQLGMKPEEIFRLRKENPELCRQLEQSASEQASQNERTRLSEIDEVANLFDPTMVQEAKYGKTACDARELAFRAAKAAAAQGHEFLKNLAADNQASGAQGVEAVPGASATGDPESLPDATGNAPKTPAERMAAADAAVAALLDGDEKK